MPDQIVPDSHVTERLQDLARVCRDSQQGYETAAAETDDDALQAMFRDFAQRRGREADELDRVIRAYGGQPAAPGGSLTGQAHRVFLALRIALTGGDRAAALREVARGEAYAEAAFDRVKRLALAGEARELVLRLHESVRQSRDKVRRLAAAAGNGRAFATGQRYLDAAGRYVSEQPVMGSVMALGLGFVIGALTVAMTRPTRGRAR
jgi:uncharacterized protein (TIGR02284 family)